MPPSSSSSFSSLRFGLFPWLPDTNPESVVVMLSGFALRKAFFFSLIFGFYSAQKWNPKFPNALDTAKNCNYFFNRYINLWSIFPSVLAGQLNSCYFFSRSYLIKK